MKNRADRTILEIVDARRRATIVRRADGQPIRQILPGHRTIPVGLVTSAKAGRPLAYESKSELTIVKICEMDVAVKKYLTQPHLLRIETPSGAVDYYPDLERTFGDGTISIVEAKGDRDRRTTDPRYVEKLELAAAVYDDLGYQFEVVHERELRSSTIAAVSCHMWPNRFAAIPGHLSFQAADLAATRTATMGDLVELLGGGALGDARLDALAIARRVTWADYPRRRRGAVCRPVHDLERALAWSDNA